MERHGLEMVEIMNLEEFFETYRAFHEEMATNFGVFRRKERTVDKDQRKLVSLFAVFVFQKREESVKRGQ